MPTPANVLTNAVGSIVSSFLQIGFEALPVIGVALLGVAGLFVLFYLVARSFGWHLKMPVRPAGKKGVLGNPKKVHFERGKAFSFRDAFNGAYSRFWSLQTEVKPTSKFFLRPVAIGGGLAEGRPSFGGGDFVPGFGSDFMPFGEGDGSEDEWGGDWADRDDGLAELLDYDELDNVDDHDGFQMDVSDDGDFTSDVGPDSIPGSDNGGVSGRHDGIQPASQARVNAWHSALNSGAYNREEVLDGLVYAHEFHPDLHESMPVFFHSGLLKQGDGFSWSFIPKQDSEETLYQSSSHVIGGLEQQWEDVFGYCIDLGDGESSLSAELSYHAARILELNYVRQSVAGSGIDDDFDQDMDGEEHEDLAAYDR